jgi:hypothetical protein
MRQSSAVTARLPLPPSGTAAIGMPPVIQMADGRFVDVSGQGPSFPSLDGLPKDHLMVTVGSWARMNPGNTSTNDFVVDMAAYAPGTTPITRVSLVDIDVPCTQQLIEPAWSRVYFGQGVTFPADQRAVDVTVTAAAATAAAAAAGDAGCATGTAAAPASLCTASVVLPLLLDRVVTYEKLPDGRTVRLFTTHRAPAPIRVIAEGWGGLAAAGCGVLQVVGIPGMPPLQLAASMVRDAGTSLAFDVVSDSLTAALADVPPAVPTSMYLYASPSPGPAHVAAVLSRGLTSALNAQLVGAAPDAMSVQWAVDITYVPQTDRFTLCVRPGTSDGFGCAASPRGCTLALAGPVLVWMGFPSPLVFPNLAPGCGLTVPMDAHCSREHCPTAYADLAPGTPRTGAAAAELVAAAFNAFDWGGPAADDGFTFRVLFPGAEGGPVTVFAPGGRATLAELAQGVEAALAAAATPFAPTNNIQVVANASGAGLEFHYAATPLAAFGLDFSGSRTGTAGGAVVGVPFAAARIGYDNRRYGAAADHWPVRPATHAPCLCGPLLPMSATAAFYREDTRQMVFATQAFEPFAGVVAAQDAAALSVTVATAGGFLHGLQPGAQVLLCVPDGDGFPQQYAVVITAAPSTTTFDAVAASGTLASTWPFAASTSLTVAPQDVMPLDLYLQRSRPAALPPQVLGFRPTTYEACCELVSPGHVDLVQDPFIILALGFDAGVGDALTGHLYYPFPPASKASNVVFAKVLRAANFQTSFDKTFDFTFSGGTSLGFVRVRVLNPDGSLYQTHGHPLSVTLRFDAKASGFGFGAGYTAVGPRQGVVPIGGGGRASVVGYHGGAGSDTGLAM